MHDLRPLLAHIGALGLIVGLLFVIVRSADTGIFTPTPVSIETTLETESATTSDVVDESMATSTVEVISVATTAQKKPKAKKASVEGTKSPSSTTSSNQIVRIENPYSTPPLDFETVNIAARSALVNILCTPKTTGAIKPISGSGIFIDSRGVILTNAHVAQYVLLAQSGRTDLECDIRSGAPATAKWIPVVMYIPPVWIETHAKDITTSKPVGTGEHDYALLYVLSSISGSPLPSSFPTIKTDTRSAIGFVDDAVLTASYPVEFLGGLTAQNSLYPVTSITAIKKLMTFGVSSPDVLSLGGVIQAQGGSSGGAVLNQWARLIGIVTTTSEGTTTAERDLHAVALSYVDRDLKALTGYDLSEVLAGDPKERTVEFSTEQAGRLADLLIAQILGQ